MPDIGDFKDVAVIEVLVKPGDTVKAEQSLITVESDKASMEIPSSQAGVVKELKVKVGDKVNIGDLLRCSKASAAARRRASCGAGHRAGACRRARPRSRRQRLPARPRPPRRGTARARPDVAPRGKLPHASPSVRKFARELGVPLDEVKGSGPKGRITAGRRAEFHQVGDERRAQTAGAGGQGAGSCGRRRRRSA